METRSVPPRLELKPFIRAFAQRRTLAGELPILEACPAQLEQLLEFQIVNPLHVSFGDGRRLIVPDVFLHGAITARAEVQIPANHEGFAVFFEPTGLSQLLGVPTSELTNQVHDATSVLGHGIRFLYEQIAKATSFQQRVNIVERFFLQRLGHIARMDPMYLAAIYLLKRRDIADVSNVADRFNLSIRQFERRFCGSVGLPPKLWARIVRFQSALDIKVVTGRTWLEIAHARGYYDQMHMIHEFKKFAGQSPSQLLAQLGDMRPEAVASAVISSSESRLRAA